MTEQNRDRQGEVPSQDAAGGTPREPAGKKTFVEPAISHPVDVLEATTFFQVVDSGGTGLKRKGDESSKPAGLWVYD